MKENVLKSLPDTSVSKNILIEEYCILNTLKEEKERNSDSKDTYKFHGDDTYAYLDDDNYIYYEGRDESTIDKTLYKLQQDKNLIKIIKKTGYNSYDTRATWEVQIVDKEKFLEYYNLVKQTLEKIEKVVNKGELEVEITSLKKERDEFRSNVIDKQIVEELKAENKKLKEQANKDKLNPKRKATLQKLVLAMAIKFKFNPNNKKNSSTAQFRDILHKAGLSVDNNVIRDAVKDAYEEYKNEMDKSLFEN